jgi:hypothetical protein
MEISKEAAIVLVVGIVVVCALLQIFGKKHVRKTIYCSPKDVFRKENCPRCVCKMKKIWYKKPEALTRREARYTAIPIFHCERCGYAFRGDGKELLDELEMALKRK